MLGRFIIVSLIFERWKDPPFHILLDVHIYVSNHRVISTKKFMLGRKETFADTINFVLTEYAETKLMGGGGLKTTQSRLK